MTILKETSNRPAISKYSVTTKNQLKGSFKTTKNYEHNDINRVKLNDA